MKYSVRNTIILVLTLVLMVGGGWLYIYNRFNGEIEGANATLQQKQTQLQGLQEYANQFSAAQANYNDAIYTRVNHPKELFPTHSSSKLYDYLQLLNRGISFTDLDFTFSDSVRNEDHGIINAVIKGEGEYKNLANFLYRIEYSRPLIKIQSVELNNLSETNKLSRVDFTINLGAYYRRGQWTKYRASLEPSAPLGDIVHNPYYPLIHDVPPNNENLPDVEQSRLIALTSSRAHIIDQSGRLQRLAVGDRVYLGRLTSINLERQQAIFQLNKGGIADRVVLTLEHENSPEG